MLQQALGLQAFNKSLRNLTTDIFVSQVTSDHTPVREEGGGVNATGLVQGADLSGISSVLKGLKGDLGLEPQMGVVTVMGEQTQGNASKTAQCQVRGWNEVNSNITRQLTRPCCVSGVHGTSDRVKIESNTSPSS